MNRKSFLKTLGLSGAVGAIVTNTGCQTSSGGGMSDSDFDKLVLTIEQAAFVLALKLKENPDNVPYLELSANALEAILADNKLDPSDILEVILQQVKNSDVVLGLTSVLTIYRIWFNDASLEYKNERALKLLNSLLTGLKNGLSAGQVRSFAPTVFRAYDLKSESLNNAVKAHFDKYQ